MTEPSTDVRKWGDSQQYVAEPHVGVDPTYGVQPKVTLLSMTERPLAVLAAFTGIYSGTVTRSLDDVSEADMRKALADVQATHLQAPLEAIKLHFLIEGVDRAFTHQLVRQRTAVYGQESMRFAVVEGGLLESTSLPPSLLGTQRSSEGGLLPLVDKPEQMRRVWDDALRAVDTAYTTLVNSGMPAEEARGLLPHATATRLHFITDLRNLIAHAGNRLCTQAQFHWRLVFTQIVDEIARYGDGLYGWQHEAIASSEMFRPVCYQLGRCPFKASFDRECSIRSRVDRFEKEGVPSRQWGDAPFNDQIKTEDWLLNPGAARTTARRA